jgi:phage N-6-adenine-methyltransferase
VSGPRAKAPYPFKGRTDWETPFWLFDMLHAEFRFSVDAAAAEHNAKLPSFWTASDDGLKQSWAGHRVFCNPPYGAATGAWAKKAAAETLGEACELAALLVPANTETSWWRHHVMPSARELRFIYRRIHFLLNGQRVQGGRPVFSSVVLVYRQGKRSGPLEATWLDAPHPRTLHHGRPIGELFAAT